jgi:hypothetical protein
VTSRSSAGDVRIVLSQTAIVALGAIGMTMIPMNGDLRHLFHLWTPPSVER